MLRDFLLLDGNTTMENPMMLDTTKDIFERNIESCESNTDFQGIFLDCNYKNSCSCY